MLPSALLRDHPAARPSFPAPTRPAAPRRPTNLVLLIPDGLGPAGAALAREYRRHRDGPSELALDPHHIGSVRTHAADHRITDSAAAATAYATGTKTRNGAVATDPEGRPLGTLLEGARANGMATGLVATSRLTHATPAAFSAHTPDRDREGDIARQQVEQGIDVLLGGGLRHFRAPDDADGPSPLRRAERRGYQVVHTADGLDGAGTGPLLGLFADDHMAYEVDRPGTDQPSLAAMARAALDRLADHGNGFVLVVEGSRIDHAAHVHDPATQLREVLAFDRAASALLSAVDRTDTLVVSVADHETGGLTLGRTHDGAAACTWHPSALTEVSASTAVVAETLRDLHAEHAGSPLLPDAVAEVIHHFIGVQDLSARERDRLATADAAPSTVAALLNRRARLDWTTDGHTATDVSLCATGPGAARLAGHHDNTAVGRILATLLDVDLSAVTARGRSRAAGS